MYLILSTSLNPNSRSRVLAREVVDRLTARSREVHFYDLQEVNLPMCDGGACYAEPEVQRLGDLVRAAQGILIATPIYNYDAGAAAKNVVELTGKAWMEKVVGFVCAAGGGVSYMAPMGLANSLMLDFRSFILPKFVFTTGNSFDENNRLIDEEVVARLDELINSLVTVTEALNPPAAGDHNS